MAVPNPDAVQAAPSDFIRDIVAADVAAKRYPGIVTRFPPEPNGYLHIGHAKAICLDFGIARENGGRCNLRLDDTNPAKEDIEYVEAIVEDVRWLISGWADQCLGLKPDGSPFYASDYFGKFYEHALTLIRAGKAYVCDLTAKETEEYRGSPDRPGRDSPYRSRSVGENLDLFQRMKAGEFPDGSRTLRARIDMASPNIWLRDPLLYRIRHTEHHQTGAEWCIYPMYDYAHCLSDYIEGVSHSLCTLEFVVHRPLYDWVLESLSLPGPLPHQYEFARLKIGYTVMSKRKMLQFVAEGIVYGMGRPADVHPLGLQEARRSARHPPPICNGHGHHQVRQPHRSGGAGAHTAGGSQRDRAPPPGRPPPAEGCPHQYPRRRGHRVGGPEQSRATPRRASGNSPLTSELFIDTDDFMESPPPKYFRLRPGGEVRLKYACIITCQQVVKDPSGAPVELHCIADLDSRTGGPNASRKVKGTIHWVSATHSFEAEVRLYDRLFTVEDPDAGEDLRQFVNPKSLEVLTGRLELALREATPDHRFQFERLGYFAPDPKDSRPGHPVFNRTITLKDTWAKK